MYMHLHRHPEARGYCVIDLDLKKSIDGCFSANDDTGEYEFFTRDDKGELIVINKKDGTRFTTPGSHRKFKWVNGKTIWEDSPVLLSETRKGNIKIVRASEKEEFIRGLK